MGTVQLWLCELYSYFFNLRKKKSWAVLRGSRKGDYSPACFRVKHQPSSCWLLHLHKDADDTGPGTIQIKIERSGLFRTEKTWYKHTLELIGSIQEIGAWLFPVFKFEHRDTQVNGKGRKLKSEERKHFFTQEFQVSLEWVWMLMGVDSNLFMLNVFWH